MTRDNDRPGFLADNVTVLDDDAAGIAVLLGVGKAVQDVIKGFMLGVVSADNDDLVPVLGHPDSDLAVTLEPRPRLIRIDRS